ncbi:MAG: hypothetical protein U0996_23410 [Planctomycetaceae bacterium]
MAERGFQSDSNGSGHNNSSEPEDACGDSLLEQILRGSELGMQSAEGQAIMDRLRQTADKIGDCGFDRDIVLLPLVAEILSPFRPLTGTSFQKMCQSVTGTIYDDVASRERAMKLWDRLRRTGTP